MQLRDLSGMRRVQSRVLALPFHTQAANGFAQPYSEVDDCFEALHGDRRKSGAMLRQKQLRISENSGQRVIDFVAQNFGEVCGKIRHPRGAKFMAGRRRMKPPFDKRGHDSRASAGARDKIDFASQYQAGELRLPLRQADGDDRSEKG